MFNSGYNVLRDHWDALECDSELLLLAVGDDLGDDNSTKRFNAAAAISPPHGYTRGCVCIYKGVI